MRGTGLNLWVEAQLEGGLGVGAAGWDLDRHGRAEIDFEFLLALHDRNHAVIDRCDRACHLITRRAAGERRAR